MNSLVERAMIHNSSPERGLSAATNHMEAFGGSVKSPLTPARLTSTLRLGLEESSPKSGPSPARGEGSKMRADLGRFLAQDSNTFSPNAF